jgi:hypothetical protein
MAAIIVIAAIIWYFVNKDTVSYSDANDEIREYENLKPNKPKNPDMLNIVHQSGRAITIN